MQSLKFSESLQAKIDHSKSFATPVKLGQVQFDSKLILAPMAGICTPPFRLLMEDLGAGGTVSELISCHGILYNNKRTLEMLKIDPRERNIGIQLFGETAEDMAQAAQVAQTHNPKFIDINMGCPVRKVVNKGGGSALLKDIKELPHFFKTIKEAINIPLSIKIRTGWDGEDINADLIEKIALDAGIEWVAIHGRTRAQQYTGHADWKYIEWLKSVSTLPIVGNGDLHRADQVKYRLSNTKTDALMIARGALRSPFIFLESLLPENDGTYFNGRDYWEVIQRLYEYTSAHYENERTCLVQMRKLIVWFAAGLPKAAKFRGEIFSSKDLTDSMKISEDYYLSLENSRKNINYEEAFMNSGHG